MFRAEDERCVGHYPLIELEGLRGAASRHVRRGEVAGGGHGVGMIRAQDALHVLEYALADNYCLLEFDLPIGRHQRGCRGLRA